MPFEIYETSSAQKRQYLVNKIIGPNIIYNMPSIRTIAGKIDLVKLRKALQLLVIRHEGLRTAFIEENSEIAQKVYDSIEVNLKLKVNLEKEIDEIIDEFIRPFRLEQAPLWRAELVQISDGQMLFLFDIHHIISDAVTINIIFEELMAYYFDKELPDLDFQYVDFAIWHNDQMQGDNILKQEKYWMKEYDDGVPQLILPIDGRRDDADYSGSIVSLDVEDQLAKSLRSLCLTKKVTIYSALLSIFGILLSKYSGQDDFVIGSPIAGRTHLEFERVVGMFVNTLALRQKVDGSMSFLQYMLRVADKTYEAFENQDYPFEMLVEKINPERSNGRNPLFDVCFILQNIFPDHIQKTEFIFRSHDFEHKNSKFDLSLYVYESEESFRFHLEYKKSLFTEGFAKGMMKHLQRIIELVVNNPEIAIDDISLISEKECREILYRFNDTQVEYPSEMPVHLLFEKQAEMTPDKIALIHNKESLTYEELNSRANQLARVLMEKGTRTQSVVGIMVKPSIQVIIGILAILKTGAAYVPIDSLYPMERIKYILEDTKGEFCLFSSEDRNIFLGEEGDKIFVDVDVESINIKNLELYTKRKDNLHDVNSAGDLMYIIYTSGSTGKPKGVMVEHRALTRFVMNPQSFTISDKDCVLQTTSMSFDVSVFEIWATLLKGATLCLVDKEVLLNPRKLVAYMEFNKVTLSWFTASLLNQLVDEDVKIFKSLRTLITGGEILSPHHINRIKKINPELLIVNGYGPTEGTIFTTFHNINKYYEDSIPIGKPVANTRAYVLNELGQMQPIGIYGELFIGGDGLARGYLNAPDLTRQKFVPDAFLKGHRMYKSGDRCRWLADGTIEITGRIDRQVKISGYRIELGEIEKQLSNIDGIKQAIVVDLVHPDGSKYLCAYYTENKELSAINLRKFLERYLPGYMIPNYFVKVEKIPLKPNGKTDSKALPTPDIGGYANIDSIEKASTQLEQDMMRIWSSILGVEEIGVNDDFFALGGSSLKAARMVSQVFDEIRVEIPLNRVFIETTIRRLARFVEETKIEDFASKAKNITLLRQGNNKERHFFFIHDGTGDISCYIDLVNEANKNLNYWGIKTDEELMSMKDNSITITDISRKYIKQMKDIQPVGPYSLAGWSLGGIITFEICRQLEVANEKVDILMIIDTLPPKRLTNIHIIKKEIRKLSKDVINIEQSKEKLPFDVKKMIPNFDKMDKEELLSALENVDKWIKLQQDYVPPHPITTDVHLFITFKSWRLMNKGWEAYCDGVLNTYKVPGNHYSIILGENAGNVSVVLNRLLDNKIRKH